MVPLCDVLDLHLKVGHHPRFLIEFTRHLGKLLLLIFFDFLHSAIDIFLTLVELLVLFLQIIETATQLLNSISGIVIIILILIGLHNPSQELGILLSLDQFSLSSSQLSFLLFDVGGKLFNGLLVNDSILFQLLQFFIFLLPFGLIVDDGLLVCCDTIQYFLLLDQELLLLLVKSLSLGDDCFFPVCEILINLTLFSFFLQETDSLKRSLRLDYEGSYFFKIKVVDFRLWILGVVFIDSLEEILDFVLLIYVHFY